MSYIDTEAFDAAFNHPKTDTSTVKKEILFDAIQLVYKMWISDLKSKKKIWFHAYFGLSLFDLGIDDLFTAEPYRKALGKYFNKRAILAKARARTLIEVPKNGVDSVSEHAALIRLIPEVTARFKATIPFGKLNWQDVDHLHNVIHDDQDHETHHLVHAAKIQALAVMNTVRGF